MPEKRFRIRMITGWTGKIDGEMRTVKAGEEVDVDMDTVRALTMQHNKAELVTVDEILEAKKPPAKKPTGQRASRTRAKKKPDKDKMVKDSTQK